MLETIGAILKALPLLGRMLNPQPNVGLEYRAIYTEGGYTGRMPVLLLWARNSGDQTITLAEKHRHGVRLAKWYERRFISPSLTRFIPKQEKPKRLQVSPYEVYGTVPTALTPKGGFSGVLVIWTPAVLREIKHPPGKVRLIGRFESPTGDVYESGPRTIPLAYLQGDKVALDTLH